MSDYAHGTQPDLVMKRLFLIVISGMVFLFVKIALDLVANPWMNGFLVGGLVMLVACGLALFIVLNWPTKRKTPSW